MFNFLLLKLTIPLKTNVHLKFSDTEFFSVLVDCLNWCRGRCYPAICVGVGVLSISRFSDAVLKIASLRFTGTAP